MKIAYIRPYQGEAELVQDVLYGHEIIFDSCVWNIPEHVRAEITTLSVFVDYQVNVDVLAMLPNLKFIAGKIEENFLPKSSVDAIVNSFTLHEIYSENNCSEKVVIKSWKMLSIEKT